jgi:hypothetical protein
METVGGMCSVRDYMSPVPIMFVTDLARGGARYGGGGGTKSFPYRSSALGSCANGGGGPVGGISSIGCCSSKQQPTLSIYDKIRTRKESIARDQSSENIAKRKAELQSLLEERGPISARYQIKRRRALVSLIQEKEREIERLVSGEALKEFVEQAEPYVRAYQRQQFCRPSSTSSCIVAAAEVVESSGSVQTTGMVPQDQSGKREALPAAEEYAVDVEGAVPRYDIEMRDVCRVCGEAAQLNTTLSILVCVKCGATQPFLDATAALLAYSDDSYDYASFSYKRINHFSEWMSAMQAKETTDIPQSVVDTIMQRLYEERITSSKDVTCQKVRAILKALRLRKYYEHTQLITSKITGESPPRMTPVQEEKIKLMFMAASSSFQRHCPPDRANFLSYGFVLLKFVELLGYDEFIPYFILLKGREKLYRQDIMWKAIAEDLDWAYIPSLSS